MCNPCNNFKEESQEFRYNSNFLEDDILPLILETYLTEKHGMLSDGQSSIMMGKGKQERQL